MTRRAAGVLAAAVLVVAGCTGDGDSPPSSTTRSAPEGALRVGVPEEAATLDPFDPRSRTPAASAVLGEILPQLFRVDPGGRVRGYLADEESVREEGGAAASFRLRDGARWSDGTDISAADLRFTLETVRSGNWPGPKMDYERVVAVEGEGPSVRLVFDGPFPGWKRLFSGADFLLPAHRLSGQDLTTVWRQGPDVAGGPFRLGQVTPGLEIALERNDRWWGDGPRVETLRVVVVPDVRTMEQLLGQGDLDVAWPPATVNRTRRFRALEDVDVSVAEPGGRVVSLVANVESVPPSQRRDVLGIPNRDRFVDVLLDGEAKRAVTLAGVDGGPEAAWAKAGGPSAPGADAGGLARGGTFTLVAAIEEPMAPLLGRLLEAGVREAGATLELKLADAPMVDGRLLRDGGFDFALVDDVAWPQPCWRCWFTEGATAQGNVSRVKGVDELAAGADRGEVEAAPALEVSLRDDAVLLPLWRPLAVLAGRGVDGLAANSWSLGPFWEAENWTRVVR
ncbi:MAG: ABC transporter substrate-binding protein [Acidimicrobiia bacterium]